MERIPILYDADCRFCRVSLAAVLVWDRRRRLRPVALQDEEARRLVPGLTEEQRLAEAHLAPPQGEPVSGDAIAGPVLRELPGGAPLARLADRLPGAAQSTYTWVAAHRGQLSKLVPGPLLRRVDVLLSDRSRYETSAGRERNPSPSG